MKSIGLIFILLPCFSAAGETAFKTVGPVAADFATVQAAIDSVPADNPEQKLILIQPGAYVGHPHLESLARDYM